MSRVSRIIAVLAVCAVLATTAVGVGFAYTSVTINSDNNVTSEYIIVTPGDNKYSGNFNHYFEYHWGTTVKKSDDPVSRIYSPCSWYIEPITVGEEHIQAYILGDMRLGITSTSDLNDFTVHVEIPTDRYYLISESYDYVMVASVVDVWPSEETDPPIVPHVYGDASAKYFSHYVYDEEGHLISRSYSADYVISTTSGEGKDIVLDDLPQDYDKEEYKVLLTLYLVARTLDYEPGYILGEDDERHVGVDFMFRVSADG
jgi:hypothetical protein